MNALAATSAIKTWTPRRATSLREARKRTALVHILRLLFTSGAVISAGWLVGSVISNAVGRDGETVDSRATNVTILNPRFEGRDANEQPYVIIADTARRRRDNIALIDLTRPYLLDEVSGAVRSDTGVFNRDSQILDLQGNVVMEEAGGYTFRTEDARMFIRDNRVVGRTPLDGEGPMGKVRADSYEVLDSGARLILYGNVWSQFDQTERRRASARNGG